MAEVWSSGSLNARQADIRCFQVTAMVVEINDEEWLEMQRAVLDGDKEEAFRLIKTIVRRLEQQQRSGLKSHLDGR
jgi:hypothetical protein